MAWSEPMRLAITGDSIITRRGAIFEDSGMIDLVDIISHADVAFTNLEVLPNDFQGYPALESGGSHFAAHSWVMDELTEMGFNLFGCANNHALDYSIEGLLATIEVLEAREVVFAGIGRNLAESRMPVYLDTPAGSVAMISCCSTFHTGQEAGDQRPDMIGRPGINPLRFDTVYHVTQEQFDTLRNVSLGLGLEQARLDRVQMGFKFPPDDPDAFPFLDWNFKVADEPRVETVPKEKDAAAIEAWVREARRRADFVIVSLHAHEQDGTKEYPAQFLKTFSRRMIDAGADMIAGHGPHLLRGMEVYDGKPIFYSLGNFFGQNELVWKLPADSYDRFRVDPSATPGLVYSTRYADDTKGFPADARYWRSVMAMAHYDGDRIVDLEIVPISLGLNPKPHRRGRPRVAEDDEARVALEEFARLSADFGTQIEIRGDRAFVQLE